MTPRVTRKTVQLGTVTLTIVISYKWFRKSIHLCAAGETVRTRYRNIGDRYYDVLRIAVKTWRVRCARDLPTGVPLSCRALPKIGSDGGPAMERKAAMKRSRLRTTRAMSTTAMHSRIHVLTAIAATTGRYATDDGQSELTGQ